MPVLSNPRHEKFAQELAMGKSQTDAYEAAGYKKGDRAAASKLTTKYNIRARVAELQERSAALTEITIAKLTEDLLRLAKKGETVFDEAAEVSGLSVARAAIMDAAKLNGLADRKPGADDGFVPLAERIKAYERRDAIAACGSNVVELNKPDFKYGNVDGATDGSV
jgi:hypothetical protein